MKKLIHKLKWKFRQLYQHLFYWLEWRYSDERHDPYRCCDCGSTDVEIKIWSKINEGDRPNGDCEEYERSYCNACEENVRIRPTSSLLNDAEEWWDLADHIIMYKVTGLTLDDYTCDEIGVLAFESACQEYWGTLTDKEKIKTWLKN